MIELENPNTGDDLMAAPAGNQNNNKYQQEYAVQVYKLCLMGARDQDLADFLKFTETPSSTGSAFIQSSQKQESVESWLPMPKWRITYSIEQWV